MIRCTICGQETGNPFSEDVHTGLTVYALHWIDKHRKQLETFIKEWVANIPYRDDLLIYATAYPDGDLLTVEMEIFGAIADFIDLNVSPKRNSEVSHE